MLHISPKAGLIAGSLAAALGAMTPTLHPALAQDSQSAHSFWVWEAARGTRATPQRSPAAPSRPAPDPTYDPAKGRAAKAIRQLGQEKTRYAALPKPAAKVARAQAPAARAETRKPPSVPLDLSDPVRALLRDPTLRPGDLAVFPHDLKVFRGKGAGPHQPGAFEDVARSRLVSRSTRALLAGLVPPTPAKTAQRIPLRQPRPSADVAVGAVREAGPRVVYRDNLAQAAGERSSLR